MSGETPSRVRQREWPLTEAALNGLLGRLDADREKAGEKYEQIRQRLAKFFQWRGCPNPEEYADRTIDRVARRVADGAELHLDHPFVYFHAVALNVLREHWREPGRSAESLDRVAEMPDPSTRPDRSQRDHEAAERERLLTCLERCVEALPAETRRLAVRYHGAETVHIDARRGLAEELGVPLNALRTRVCRIRASLAACVSLCMERGPS